MPNVKRSTPLTLSYLKENIHYDPLTGEFVWLSSRIGRKVRKINPNERSRIGIDGKPYLPHRLAWFYMHGEWPSEFIDHIDGNHLNNQLSNLRLASTAENMQNRRRCGRNSASGYLGVSFHRRCRKWQATIRLNNVQNYLGIYDTPEEAYAVYVAAKAKMHPFQTLVQPPAPAA